MKILLAFLFLSALASAAEPFRVFAPSRSSNSVLVVDAKPDGEKLTLALAAPVALDFPATTIVSHPTDPFLYVATNRAEDGKAPAAVIQLAPGPAPKVVKVHSTTVSNGYAYLSVDQSGKFLLGANYGGGQVDVYALEDRMIGERVTALDEGRKNAHCVLPSPDNRFVYIPYVKDTNALYQYRFDADTGGLTPLEPKDALPPDGTGPRHMAYHGELPFTYFSNEQGLGVSTYRMDPETGELTNVQVVESVPRDKRPESGVSASDIAITPDNRFLFTGLRGNPELPDAVSRYQILDDGTVKHLGLTPADETPWGLALSPNGQYLLVSAFKGNTLTAFRITEDGDLDKMASIPWDARISDLVAK
ncbi:MAG: beta-propeller fold lactonase family protein [Verrucomicrobiota bacterium]